MGSGARLLVPHGLVMVLGGLLLWQLATPLALDERFSLATVDWSPILKPALVLGAVAGVSVGILARHRVWWLGAIGMGALAMVAYQQIGISVGNIYVGEEDVPRGLDVLSAALMYWAMFVLVSLGVAAIVAIVYPRRQDRETGT